MIDHFRRFARRCFSFAADYYKVIAAVVIVGIFTYGIRRADANIRSDVNLGVLKASAEVGHLFRAYEATKSFSDEEILQLSRKDLQEVSESWKGSIKSQLSLRGIRISDGDEDADAARRGTSASRRVILPTSTGPLFRLDEPVRFAEQQVGEEWKLRTSISGRDYRRTMAWNLAPTAVLALGVFMALLFPVFYRESVLGRRHFDALIKIVLKYPSALKAEEELIARLPEFIREVLEFDTVAVYWFTDGRITLRAVDSVSVQNRNALNEAIQDRAITSDAYRHEAQVVNENRSVVVKRRGWRNALGIPESEGGREATYIIAPIFDPKKKQVVGLLSAERLRDLQPGDQAALENLGRLIMILIETARSTVQMERDFHGMIRLTRQVALGMVVPVLAHNLHTPLSMICMMARDLSRKWPQMDDDKIKNRLAQIDAQTAQCLDLIDTITEYRKIGGPHADAQTSDLCEVLERVCAFFDAYLRLRRVRLERHFQTDYRPHVKMKPLDLQQVITNLLINADEAFSERGRAIVPDKIEIRVSAVEDSDDALIRVTDNGPGIPHHRRDLVFEEDFTTKVDGTGAGLAYCKKMVKWAGGSLELEPASAGASFKIFLPTIKGGNE
ncbi:MAG: sensor histidine kinase [Thermoanaerobaculia bacterium]